MNEWLAPGRYCDWRHAAIRRIADQVVGDAVGERARAIQLYRYVRDHVVYAFGPWGIPASATLARGDGMCATKSNLLVALLRASGIPAGYGVLRVNAREYFGSVALPDYKHLGSTDSTHIYTAVRIDGRWVRCDPSTDQEIAAKTSHFCAQTRLLDWNGCDDAIDFLEPAHVYADLGLRPAVDDLLDKPPRNATPAVLSLLNDYLAFIRSRPRFDTAERLIAAYRAERWPKRVPA